jgi:hypothetical protein
VSERSSNTSRNTRALRAANRWLERYETHGDWIPDEMRDPRPETRQSAAEYFFYEWLAPLALIVVLVLIAAAFFGAFDSQIGAAYRAVGLL